jgi:hypothetical protein
MIYEKRIQDVIGRLLFDDNTEDADLVQELWEEYVKLLNNFSVLLNKLKEGA